MQDRKQSKLHPLILKKDKKALDALKVWIGSLQLESFKKLIVLSLQNAYEKQLEVEDMEFTTATVKEFLIKKIFGKEDPFTQVHRKNNQQPDDESVESNYSKYISDILNKKFGELSDKEFLEKLPNKNIDNKKLNNYILRNKPNFHNASSFSIPDITKFDPNYGQIIDKSISNEPIKSVKRKSDSISMKEEEDDSENLNQPMAEVRITDAVPVFPPQLNIDFTLLSKDDLIKIVSSQHQLLADQQKYIQSILEENNLLKKKVTELSPNVPEEEHKDQVKNKKIKKNPEKTIKSSQQNKSILIKEIERKWNRTFGSEALQDRFYDYKKNIEASPELQAELHNTLELARSLDVINYTSVKTKNIINQAKNKNGNVDQRKLPWPLRSGLESYGAFSIPMENGLLPSQVATTIYMPYTAPVSNIFPPRTDYFKDRNQRKAFLAKYYKPFRDCLEKNNSGKIDQKQLEEYELAAAKALLILFSHIIDEAYYLTEEEKGINRPSTITFINEDIARPEIGFDRITTGIRSKLSDLLRDLIPSQDWADEEDETLSSEKDKALSSLHEEKPSAEAMIVELTSMEQATAMEGVETTINRKVKKIVVRKKPFSAKIGEKIDDIPSHYTKIGKEDVDVYEEVVGEDGKVKKEILVLAFRKNALARKSETKESLDAIGNALHSSPEEALSDLNKYLAMITQDELNKNGARRPYDEDKDKTRQITSGVFGIGGSDHRLPIMPTKLLTTTDHGFEIYRALSTIVAEVEKVYKEVAPEEFASVAKRVSKYPALLFNCGEVTSQVNVNSGQTGLHKDNKQNEGKRFSALIVVNTLPTPASTETDITTSVSGYTGCELVYDELELAVEHLEPKDVLIADFQNYLHRNAILKRDEALYKDNKDNDTALKKLADVNYPLRRSLVFYLRQRSFELIDQYKVFPTSDPETDITKEEIKTGKLQKIIEPSTNSTFFKCVAERHEKFKTSSQKWKNNEKRAVASLEERKELALKLLAKKK